MVTWLNASFEMRFRLIGGLTVGSNATTYSYTDGNHELTKVTPPSGNSLQPRTLTYDGFGRLATVTDGAGNTTTYTYDALPAAEQAALPPAKAITAAFSGVGELTVRVEATGAVDEDPDGQRPGPSQCGRACVP